MRKLAILVLLIMPMFGMSQDPAVIDSFKRVLANAKTSEARIEILGPLALTYMNSSKDQSDTYGELLIRESEMTRNRVLMVKALQLNGQRYAFFTGNTAFLQKSLDYYNRALELSRKNKLARQTAECMLSLSTVYTAVPDLNKAMEYATEAAPIASDLNFDSLKMATYYSIGAIYQLKKQRILALRNYLVALKVAEESKDPLLMRSCYTVLAQFYSELKEYDKAIDFLKKASDQLPLIRNMPNNAYNAVVDMYMMGDLYLKKKDFSMSRVFFDSSIAMAESLHYGPLKMPGYRGILRQYIMADQPNEALAYLNQSAGLKQFVTNFGAGYVIDNAYGSIYTQLKNFDSAAYYFKRASVGLEAAGTPSVKLQFYYQYGDFYDQSGKLDSAVSYYAKAMEIADQLHDMEWQQRIAKELDTLYADKGDFKQSRYFGGLYHAYKDSIQKLGEEKDLLQMELADEEQRQQRKDREAAEELRDKHNIQYMGITIAIAVFFLLLVMMGAFKVSEATIKIMGFFGFIFLFEFIILIADNQIHEWTHGEPLPVLGIKIVLIAILLPLHHWMEHRVVHYLASRRLIIPDRKSIWNSIVSKKSKLRREEGQKH